MNKKITTVLVIVVSLAIVGAAGYFVLGIGEEPETYTLTYDSNGGTGVVIDDNTYNYEDKAVLIFDNPPTKTNYIFGGWIVDGWTYDEIGDSITMYEDRVAIAKWIPTYTLTYDVNGGIGSVVDNNRYAPGQKALLKFENLPTRENYRFGGWNVDGWTYDDAGDTVRMSNNKVAVAVWEPTISIDYQMSYNEKNGFSYSGYANYPVEVLPMEGHKFVTMKITYTNVNMPESVTIDEYDFSISTDAQHVYDFDFKSTFDYRYHVSHEESATDIKVSAGGSYTFTMIFQIPENETPKTIKFDNYNYNDHFVWA